eukprot:CAMPEP_0170570560 /NCGR_PEP_ID=MMETSP0224-20130122/1180_1 /TAXON_ID=285029 /ORGANISM="Togula jolla, Strain CCCM 725" /LENGTH=238 /DNA_ID=CAMNT_0010892855 /DNA_START=46 /DNA_END=759 /DNA_ORIENTATION=+
MTPAINGPRTSVLEASMPASKEDLMTPSTSASSISSSQDLNGEDLGQLGTQHVALGSTRMRLCLRNGFIDVEDGPQLEERVRSSSAPPCRQYRRAQHEQPNYIQKLEDRTNRLRSTLKNELASDLESQDVAMAWQTSTSTTASSTEASIGAPTKAESSTSFMLCNIPYRATKKDITAAMDHMGFKGTYLFCHVPNANKKKPRATNLGYAFIGFASSSYASAFSDSFSNFRFLNISTAK